MLRDIGDGGLERVAKADVIITRLVVAVARQCRELCGRRDRGLSDCYHTQFASKFIERMYKLH
jgi:phosphate uptake regulator